MNNGIMLFLSISGGEILVIVLVVYLVFGPKKIPELARMLGKGMNELRRATNDIKNEITKETGNIKKDMDIGIDLKDPFDLKKPKSTKKPTEPDKKEPASVQTEEPHQETSTDVPDSTVNEDQKTDDAPSPSGSVPRN